MLEETYERSFNHNYMIIQAKKREYTGFCEKIIQENEISGLLPCQFRVLEGSLFFYYEISGKKTVSQLFQKKKIGTSEMRRLLMALSAMQRESQRYLLDFQKYILLPEYLYSDFDIKHLYAVYYPDYEGRTALGEIGSFFIEHVDYQETEAVELAYSFQQRIMEENVSLEFAVDDLLKEKKAFSSENICSERKKEPAVSYERKDERKKQVFQEKEELVRKELYCSVDKQNNTDKKNLFKEKWKLDNLQCIQEIRSFLSGLAIFKREKKSEIHKVKKEKPVYEVKMDLDENEREAPFFSQSLPSEETQFFSCQEEQEVHVLIYQGRKNLPDLELEVFPFIIGKGEKGIDGRIEMPAVSRIHSQLDYINNNYFIMDLNSTNGTFLNGERLPPNIKKCLSAGDQIQFAGEKYIFQ